MKILRVASLAALCGVASTAGAEEMEIRAEFTVDATNPGANKFVNKTPSTGFCATWSCGDLFSLIVPIETSPIAIEADAALRQGGMIRVSNEERIVQVSTTAGETSELSFRVVNYGARYNVVPNANVLNPEGSLYGHTGLWNGGTWYYAGTCAALFNPILSAAWYEFFWRNKTGGECGRSPTVRIPNFHFTRFTIGYELTTPNPLTMASGTYRGSVTYTVAPGGDIDFGDASVPTANELVFNFVLEVNHILNVRFPAGANRLTLYPPGGWRPWLANNRVPDKLIAHQDFQIWSSGQFKMQLKCEHSANDGCAIENRNGDRVPVTTRVTLPSGLTGPAGLVKETPLSETTPLLIDSTHYVDNGRARLDFEVAHAGVEQMTGNAGTKYSGNVTVIWDGQI